MNEREPTDLIKCPFRLAGLLQVVFGQNPKLKCDPYNLPESNLLRLSYEEQTRGGLYNEPECLECRAIVKVNLHSLQDPPALLQGEPVCVEAVAE